MFLSIDPGWSASQRAKIMPIVIEGSVDIPAALGVTSRNVLVASANIPQNYRAYILSYGVTVRQVPAYDFSGSLGFNLLVGDAPYLSNAAGQWSGERGSIAHPTPTLIQLDGEKRVRFLSTRLVASAQASTVSFFATGFMIPIVADNLCAPSLPHKGK